MRHAKVLLSLLTLFSLPGCASHVAKREARKEAVLREVKRLEEEQGQWLIAVNDSNVHVERVLAEKRKASEIAARESGDPILARVEILSMERDPFAPFRFRGRLRLQQPAVFRGREVDGFLLSHERDLTTLAGQTIDVATHTRVLDLQLEPMGAFSINGRSTLAADDQDGRFQQFGEKRFSKPLNLIGRIVDFAADPDNKTGYFMYDILFSGDVSTVLIESPILYRGAKLRVLVEHSDNSERASWAELGAQVMFSTAEATVAWEPWGFTRAAELKDVRFPVAADRSKSAD
jgi:hypothetical protein